MSKDIILSIKKEMAQHGVIEKGLDDDTRALAGNSSNANKRISIKGGMFRKIVGGKEIGSIDDRFMNVIIVRSAHAPCRTFYSKAYKEGSKVSPDCWSSDSITPAPDVKNPVSPKCNTCPMSIKGSAQGGSGSACRLFWRAAVVLPQDPGGDVMQLVIPSTSIWGKEEDGKFPYKAYGQLLVASDIKLRRLVTRMQFDTKNPVPRILFSPVSPVDPKDFATIDAQATSDAADNAIKLTVFQTDGGVEEVEEPMISAATKNVLAAVKAAEVEEVPQPTLRETPKSEAKEESEVSDLVKKWSKKK